jgi:nicotinamidase-related amidase
MSRIATIVIDMLNPYDHEDADALAEQARTRIEPLQELIQATRESDCALVYVNDNFGDFASTWKDLVDEALNGRHPELVEPIKPPEGVPFVQKVRHSAFYSSALEYLLRANEIDTLILAGQDTEQCILYSPLDAYVRHFNVRIPTDAVVPIDPALGDAALQMMERNMGAELVPAAEALG